MSKKPQLPSPMVAVSLAAIGCIAVALLCSGCGGSKSASKEDLSRSAKRQVPQPPSSLHFASGEAGTTCGGQGVEFAQYGISREVYVCIGSELPPLKGKAECFLGQPSADTTGTNMLGLYDVRAQTVVAGGNSMWPEECATTLTSMLEWYYHKTQGTLRTTAPKGSTNPAPLTAPTAVSGVLGVKRKGGLTCYSTTEKYTFPDGESSLVAICIARDVRTCGAYQQSRGSTVIVGFPGSPWGPECVAALGLVRHYLAAGKPAAPTPAVAPTVPSTATVAKNLIASPAVKHALLAAHLKLLFPSQRSGVQGPLKGTTYYGSYGRWRYALATFSHPHVGTTDQPELLSKAPGMPWRDRGDTGGCLSKGIIPQALLRVWHLHTKC